MPVGGDMSPTEEQSLRITGLGRQVEEKARSFSLFPSLLLTVLHNSYFIMCLLEVGTKENSQAWEEPCYTE